MTDREKTVTEELREASDLVLEIMNNSTNPRETPWTQAKKIGDCIERATRRISRIRSEIVCHSEEL